MVWYIAAFLLLVVGAVWLSSTRAVKLKRMAQFLHLRYDERVDNPLTEFAAKEVHLFEQAIYQFSNVLTWREPGVFIRLCEARTQPLPSGDAPQQHYTLATAELTRGTFTPFVLQARTGGKNPVHPALPESLAARFTLTAPEDFQFPAEVVGFLKTGEVRYLEATPYALIYHVGKTVAVDQLQPMRLRVQQFAKALLHEEKTTVSLSPKDAALISSSIDSQAATLLKMHTAAKPVSGSGNGLRVIFLLGGVAFIMVMLWAAQYMLRHWMH